MTGTIDLTEANVQPFSLTRNYAKVMDASLIVTIWMYK
jgi:hypothetical protein